MNVPAWVWIVTIAVLVVLVVVDFLVTDTHPHRFGVREATRWVVVYVALAAAFGVVVLFLSGPRYAGEFFAGWLTEYSLSVDNLFVFVLILTAFAVPAVHQHKALLFGIVVALVLRGVFIAAGAAVISRFSAAFYVFGGFLLYTAVQIARHKGEEPDLEKNPVLLFAERHIPVTRTFHGSRSLVRVDGRLFATPMLIVMIALGTTDLLFALDSIPAIFGLTKEPYLVFTANAFALMGLRQLYFLLHGLLDRLVYLSYGLAFILSFIGAKLVLEAAHHSWAWLPEIPIWVSLAVIVVTLAVTTAVSLLAVRRNPALVRRTAVEHPQGEALLRLQIEADTD